MARRSRDQMMDEVVFAVASTVAHYGASFNGDGLVDLRRRLAFLEPSLCCNSAYICDVNDDDPWADHHERVVIPSGWRVMDWREFLASQIEALSGVRPEAEDSSTLAHALDSANPEVRRLADELVRAWQRVHITDAQAATLARLRAIAWDAEQAIMREHPDLVAERSVDGLTLAHALFMARAIQNNPSLGIPTRACRWLGWLQCLLAIHVISDLEKSKSANRTLGC